MDELSDVSNAKWLLFQQSSKAVPRLTFAMVSGQSQYLGALLQLVARVGTQAVSWVIII